MMPSTLSDIRARIVRRFKAESIERYGFAELLAQAIYQELQLHASGGVTAPSAHENTHVSGGSDAFLSTDLIEAGVKRLVVSGPTTLTVGTVADGEVLKRVGTTLVGASASSGISGTAGEIDVAAGVVGLADNPIVPGTGAITLPVGNRAARPSTPAQGMVRFNPEVGSLSGDLEMFDPDSGTWVRIWTEANFAPSLYQLHSARLDSLSALTHDITLGGDFSIDAAFQILSGGGGPHTVQLVTTGNTTLQLPTTGIIATTADIAAAAAYTDEMAQDAVGAMIDTTLEYVDATPLLRRAALTGDVTASAGSNSTTIANSAVGLAKMADMSTASLLGRSTAGVGAPEVLSASATKSLLSLDNVENTALSSWAGSTNLTTLGTITSGTWHGSAIAVGYGGTGLTAAGDAGSLLMSEPDATEGTAWRASELHGVPCTPAGVYEFALTYDSGTRTWTLTPSGSAFYVYIAGKRYKWTGVQTVTHANANGGHFLYVNASGVLETSQTPWSIPTMAQIAYVMWHTTDGALISIDERHTASSNMHWHDGAHHTIGTLLDAYVGMPSLSGYTLATDTTAAVTWALTSFRVRDEDLYQDTPAVVDGGATSYPVLYLDATTIWRRYLGTFGDGKGVPFLSDGTTISYDKAGSGITPLTLTGSGSWVNVYIMGTTGLTSSDRVFLRAGNAIYSSLLEAQAVAPGSDITWPATSPTEWVPVYRLTYHAQSSFSASTHYAQLDGIQVISGSRYSASVAPSGSHAALTNLAWTSSGHTGTASRIAAFASVTGAATELAVGTDVQAWDADLDALAALSSTAGVLSRTGAGAFAARTLQAPAAGLTITNPTGAAGDPTFALADDLAALEALASTGYAARTGAGTWAQRTLTGTTNQVSVTNGDGTVGNPVFSTPQDIGTTSTVRFGSVGVNVAAPAAGSVLATKSIIVGTSVPSWSYADGLVGAYAPAASSGGAIWWPSHEMYIGVNWTYNSGFKRVYAGFAASFYNSAATGDTSFLYTAASGAAGSAITFLQGWTFGSNGALYPYTAGPLGTTSRPVTDVVFSGYLKSASYTWTMPAGTGTLARTTGDTFGAGSTWNGNSIGVAYLGSGTPSAGKYLDGGGSWTPLPAAPATSIGCRVYNSGDVTIPDGVETAVTFDSEVYDTDSMHSTVTLTSRITVQTAGLYTFGFNGRFQGSGGTLRIFGIRLNGGDYIAHDRHETSNEYTPINIVTSYQMAVNDYVEFMFTQNTGSDGYIQKLSQQYTPHFWAVKGA